MLTGDDAADAIELRRLIAHETRVVDATIGVFVSVKHLDVALRSLHRYERMLAETEARLNVT